MRTEKKVITEASVSRPECAASATRLKLPVTTPAASFATAKSSDTTTETQVTRAFSRRSVFCSKNVSCTPRNLPRGRQECAGPRWTERVDPHAKKRLPFVAVCRWGWPIVKIDRLRHSSSLFIWVFDYLGTYPSARSAPLSCPRSARRGTPAQVCL